MSFEMETICYLQMTESDLGQSCRLVACKYAVLPELSSKQQACFACWLAQKIHVMTAADKFCLHKLAAPTCLSRMYGAAIACCALPVSAQSRPQQRKHHLCRSRMEPGTQETHVRGRSGTVFALHLQPVLLVLMTETF